MKTRVSEVEVEAYEKDLTELYHFIKQYAEDFSREYIKNFMTVDVDKDQKAVVAGAQFYDQLNGRGGCLAGDILSNVSDKDILSQINVVRELVVKIKTTACAAEDENFKTCERLEKHLDLFGKKLQADAKEGIEPTRLRM